jgi:hypothetical protein
MIVLCELSFVDGTHAPFNAGLLETIRIAFPEEVLVFFGAPGHITALKHQVGRPLADSVSWSEICPAAPGTAYAKRYFRELRVVCQLQRILAGDSSSRLIFTSAYPSTVLAVKTACCFASSNVRVQVVLHGLSGVVGRRHRHPIRRFQDMKSALTILANKNIQYLVLEQSIRDTVVKSLPGLSDRFEVFEHPIAPNEGSSRTMEWSEPIRFGFLGLALKNKGFSTFVRLADEITAKYRERAEFHAIGRFSSESVNVQGMEALTTKPVVTTMPRVDFMRGLMSLHYIVLPHEPTAYALAASGVFLDAVAWQKPVIARKIPIFEAMFERHGDIGYLFSSDMELKNTVEQILRLNDQARYRAQVQNLRTARESRAPKNMAVTYRAMTRGSREALA